MNLLKHGQNSLQFLKNFKCYIVFSSVIVGTWVDMVLKQKGGLGGTNWTYTFQIENVPFLFLFSLWLQLVVSNPSIFLFLILLLFDLHASHMLSCILVRSSSSICSCSLRLQFQHTSQKENAPSVKEFQFVCFCCFYLDHCRFIVGIVASSVK